MKVAIYARVSTDEQTEQNQVPILESWAKQRGYEVHEVYRDIGSAWQKSDQRELRRLIEDARRGKFQVVMVWALDRLSRGGIGKMFSVLDTLQRYKVRVISNQESWTDVPSEIQPLLFSIFAWIAEQESKRISERTKAGMERVRGEGKHIGRPRIYKKQITIEDIYSKSPDIQGTRFYAVRFDPHVHPTRVKLGITRNLQGRIKNYQCQYAQVDLLGSWRCPTTWEKETIEYLTKRIELKNIGRGHELFDITQIDKICDALDTWFLSKYLSQIKGIDVKQEKLVLGAGEILS